MTVNTIKAPEQRPLSRRRFLIVAVGGAVAAGALGIVAVDQSKSGRALWVERVVRRNLPGVMLDEASLSIFVRSVLDGHLVRSRVHRAAILAQRTVPWLTSRVPKAREGLVGLERRVLTEYLIGSNFFRVRDPKRELIVYSGSLTACANPFATFT